jgi:hypothetical protein
MVRACVRVSLCAHRDLLDLTRSHLPRVCGRDELQLRVTVMDKDGLIRGNDDTVGSCIVAGRELRDSLNKDSQIEKEVTLEEGLEGYEGKASVISFRVFGGKMGSAINELDIYRESYVSLMGDLNSLQEFHIIWENMFTYLFPNEGIRPGVTWVARMTESKAFCSVSEMKNLECGPYQSVFPRHMAPTLNPMVALGYFVELLDGADADHPGIIIGGKQHKMNSRSAASSSMLTESSPDLHARVRALLAANQPQSEVIKGWKPLPTTLGICGGMGPVAGAEFAVDLYPRVEALPNKQDWEMYMYSDPAVESGKVRTWTLSHCITHTTSCGVCRRA